MIRPPRHSLSIPLCRFFSYLYLWRCFCSCWSCRGTKNQSIRARHALTPGRDPIGPFLWFLIFSRVFRVCVGFSRCPRRVTATSSMWRDLISGGFHESLEEVSHFFDFCKKKSRTTVKLVFATDVLFSPALKDFPKEDEKVAIYFNKNIFTSFPLCIGDLELRI